MTITTEIIYTFIGTIGGLGGLQYFLNFRTNKKLLKLQAAANEFQLLRETNEYLQQKLLEKEQRFDEQIERTRKANHQVVEAMQRELQYVRQIGMLQLELAHYKSWFCRRDYKDCKRRDPEQKVKTEYIPFTLPEGDGMTDGTHS